MHTVRLALYAALIGSFVFLFAACDDDPSGLGVGVGPDDDQLEGGEPVALDVLPNAIHGERRAPRTGGTLQEGGVDRFFAGRVSDPLVGDTQAESFFNVLQPTNVSSAFVDGPISEVSLVVEPTSIYGDTTETLTLALYDVSESWSPLEARSDTTFAFGDLVTTVSFSPTDDEVVIELPEEWVQENDSILRDTTDAGDAFAEAFHGFRLAHESGNAAVGFERSATELQALVGADTTQFIGQANFTNVSREGTPDLPDDRVLVQDGYGDILSFSYDFDDTDGLRTWPEGEAGLLRESPVNQAAFIAPLDTTIVYENTPTNFVRPEPSSYSLRGDLTDGGEGVLSSNVTPADEEVRFSVPGAGADFSFAQLFQESFQGNPPYQQFLVTPEAFVGGEDVTFDLGAAVFKVAPDDLDEERVRESTRTTLTVTPF